MQSISYSSAHELLHITVASLACLCLCKDISRCMCMDKNFEGLPSWWCKLHVRIRNICPDTNFYFLVSTIWTPSMYACVWQPEMFIWLEVFTLLLKITVMWDVTLYWFVICYQHFGGACCLHLQGSPRSVGCLGALIALYRERADLMTIVAGHWWWGGGVTDFTWVHIYYNTSPLIGLLWLVCLFPYVGWCI